MSNKCGKVIYSREIRVYKLNRVMINGSAQIYFSIMNFVDIFKNPLPLISASAIGFLVVYILSDKLAVRKPRKHPRVASAVDRLTPYSRKIVFTLAVGWAVSVYVYASYSFRELWPSVTYMARMFGLSALVGLFMVLSLGLIRVYFPQLSINKLLLHASRSLGLSTFMFACLHAVCAFYVNLDGKINAVSFLSTRYKIALIFSSVAFVILFLMAITSVNSVIEWMSFRRWKRLHRFVHSAIILVLFHAFLIGSHFAVVAAPLPIVIMGIALSLLFLEAGAIYKKLQSSEMAQGHQRIKWRYAGLIVLVCAGMFTASLGLRSTYNQHAGHSMVYSDAYKIDVIAEPSVFSAGQAINLRIKITDKTTGQPWTSYTVVNEKLLHLIVVSEDMQQYQHLHPDYLSDGEFTVQYTPPIESTFYLYAEFAPTTATEALARSVLTTQNAPQLGGVPKLVEGSRTQLADQYSVRLDAPQILSTSQQHKLSFVVTDTQTGTEVSDFEPYLGVLGHLAIIHENKQTYLHVHPITLTGTKDANGGRTIDFTAQFTESGTYRLYLQFKTNGHLETAAYTVVVQ